MRYLSSLPRFRAPKMEFCVFFYIFQRSPAIQPPFFSSLASQVLDPNLSPEPLLSGASPPSSCQTHLVPAGNLTSLRKLRVGCNSNHSYSHRSTQSELLNKEITCCIRSGDLDMALRIFENMTVRSTSTWNTILMGLSKKPGKLQEARELFDRIPEPDAFSYNTMLSCYVRNGDIDAAKSFFDSIPVRDIVSWNTMISGFSRNGMMSEAKQLFLRIPEKNEVTWNAMISGFVEDGDLGSALQFFEAAPIKGVIARTALLSGHMKVGKIDLAEKMFHEMPEKNLVTWNATISGFIENGRGEDGLTLFRTMLRLGFKVNRSSICSVLLGCSNLSALKLGKQVHQLVHKSPLYLETDVGTAIISMYCKCGNLKDAWRLFSEMPRKDLVTWNAMISGCAQHGDSERALMLFDSMHNKGVKPDWITFVGVLSACNYAGLVDRGVQYFDRMQEQYGVKPRPDHYTCMIDLLGRAGKFDEAMHMIQKMDFKPHPAMYGTLLGACRMYKNIEVAEFASSNLLLVDPNNPFSYVELANVYAAKNKWERVSQVRKQMKQNKVLKTPGYTWIEVNNVVHEFRSGDRLHPGLERIRVKLRELEEKLKVAGYRPNLDSALHDVEDEKKEQLLLWHSEKLAIAFGLISLPRGSTIRIFKNLKVCQDCHQATKFISAIEQREVIVRDTTRFHHFKDGICSCKDYW